MQIDLQESRAIEALVNQMYREDLSISFEHSNNQDREGVPYIFVQTNTGTTVVLDLGQVETNGNGNTFLDNYDDDIMDNGKWVKRAISIVR